MKTSIAVIFGHLWSSLVISDLRCDRLGPVAGLVLAWDRSRVTLAERTNCPTGKSSRASLSCAPAGGTGRSDGFTGRQLKSGKETVKFWMLYQPLTSISPVPGKETVKLCRSRSGQRAATAAFHAGPWWVGRALCCPPLFGDRQRSCLGLARVGDEWVYQTPIEIQ